MKFRGSKPPGTENSGGFFFKAFFLRLLAFTILYLHIYPSLLLRLPNVVLSREKESKWRDRCYDRIEKCVSEPIFTMSTNLSSHLSLVTSRFVNFFKLRKWLNIYGIGNLNISVQF